MVVQLVEEAEDAFSSALVAEEAEEALSSALVAEEAFSSALVLQQVP